MGKKYDFSLGFHGDVTLNLAGEYYNLGYNYTSKFPFVPWLHNLQVSGKNIFKDIDIPTEKETWDGELEELINDTLSLSHRLPLPPSDFNQELVMLGVGMFYAGNNRTSYLWQLEREGNLCLLQQSKSILQFLQEDSERFFLDYLDFLNNEEMLSRPRRDVQEIIRRLKI